MNQSNTTTERESMISTDVVRMKRKEPENDAQEKESDGGDDNSSDHAGDTESDSITLEIDPKALDRPVCFEPLQVPLFQVKRLNHFTKQSLVFLMKSVLVIHFVYNAKMDP